MSEEYNNLPADDDDNATNETKIVSSKDDGKTTHDVSGEAEAALRRFMEEKARREANIDDDNDDDESQVIDERIVLHIEVEGEDTSMTLTVNKEAFIGRRDPTKDDAPELDLTPHGAYQMGISRKHAKLIIQDRRLHVVDLGSRNGTYLNGKHVTPQTPTKLQDGDQLRLGKIVLHLRFQIVE